MHVQEKQDEYAAADTLNLQSVQGATAVDTIPEALVSPQTVQEAVAGLSAQQARKALPTKQARKKAKEAAKKAEALRAAPADKMPLTAVDKARLGKQQSGCHDEQSILCMHGCCHLS